MTTYEDSPETKRLGDLMLEASERAQEAGRIQMACRARTEQYREKARDAAEVIAGRLAAQGPTEHYEVSEPEVFAYVCAVELRDKSAAEQPALDAEKDRLEQEAVDAVQAWSVPMIADAKRHRAEDDARRAGAAS